MYQVNVPVIEGADTAELELVDFGLRMPAFIGGGSQHAVRLGTSGGYLGARTGRSDAEEGFPTLHAQVRDSHELLTFVEPCVAVRSARFCSLGYGQHDFGLFWEGSRLEVVCGQWYIHSGASTIFGKTHYLSESTD